MNNGLTADATLSHYRIVLKLGAGDTTSSSSIITFVHKLARAIFRTDHLNGPKALDVKGSR